MQNVEIIAWEDQYADAFITLSIEWLEKYVSVEPADKKILYHPHETILDKGGAIFFARAEAEIVGTVAMIKEGDTFELAKLAVTENYKGRKIGAMLMAKAIAFAKSQNVSFIYLFSNRKLIPAIQLYKKYGFYEVPLLDNVYIDADIKMQLDL